MFVYGCGRHYADQGDAQSPAASGGARVGHDGPARSVRVVTDYAISGVIKRVEKEDQRLTIDHEAIPGFMDAMKMRFSYADRAVLERLQPGDRVHGTLRVARENGIVRDYELRDVVVSVPTAASATPVAVKPFAQPRQLTIGEQVPDFTMTNQDAQAVRLSDLRGKVVVLTFIYTRCPLPDFCPLMDRKFSDLAEHLRNSPSRSAFVRLISLSFDPEHDTVDVLRKHAQIRGAVPPLWSYAVAAHDELAKIAAPLGLLYGPGTDDIAHNLCTAIIDTKGKLARLEVGTTRNQWQTISFLKSIYSLIPASQK
jgi:protein SCO1/2